jgi:PIN domain nuclease of toxin-antitoxin system
MVDKLSKTAIDHIENNNLMISQLVRLELQYLYEIGRLTVTPDIVIAELGRTVGLKMSEGLTGRIFDYAVESGWTRDVFDRLIVAEADACEVVLVSKDGNIRDQYARAVW